MDISRVVEMPADAYANRPADERFASMDAFIFDALEDRNRSIDGNRNIKELQAVVVENRLTLVNNAADEPHPADFTHWSFGQLARTVGAPAGYLRTLPPELAAANLNHGISATPAGTRVNLLLRAPNGHPHPTVRACTSETYGRVWDCEWADAVNRQVFRYGTNNGQWQNPPTWQGEQIAGYRNDRGSFVIQIDGGSIVEDPTLINKPGADPRLYRGVMIHNSEVGDGSVVIEVIYFRAICGNWNLFGASLGSQYRRRHVGKSVVRDVVAELAKVSRQLTNRPASADEDLIRLMAERKIASTKDALVDELKAIGISKEDALAAYARCEASEYVSPFSYWGIAQGLTRLSQENQQNADDRYDLDKLAGVVLSRAAKLVAA